MFNPLEPDVSQVRISDIAHGSSMMCRYGGQCGQFYSVAEHSVNVAEMLKQWGYDARTQMAGLLHDSDEALGLPDLPRPVKDNMPGYREKGEIVQKAVFAKWGLEWPMPKIVHVADNSVLFLKEKPVLMGNKNSEHWQYDGELRDANITIWCFTPRQAELKFLEYYYKIEKEMNVRTPL